ncbi:MAG: hypothetical protein AAGB29_09320 [Planctomycetota bacterium]
MLWGQSLRPNPSTILLSRLPRVLGIAALSPLLSLGLMGCGEETEITVYDAPKEPPGVRAVPPFVEVALGGGDMATAGPSSNQPMSSQPVPAGPRLLAEWELPAGWSAIDPAPPPAAFAFAVPSDASAEPLTATVTALPGTGGGLMPNLNRWRRQLGLPPISQPNEQPMTLIEMTRATPSSDNPTQAPGAIQAIFTDMVSADGDRRRLAAIWPDPTRNATWFFTIVGEAEPVAQATPAFQAFIASTRPVDAPASPSAPVGEENATTDPADEPKAY